MHVIAKQQKILHEWKVNLMYAKKTEKINDCCVVFLVHTIYRLDALSVTKRIMSKH